MFELFAKVLDFFYNLTSSYGFAIILLTVVVRLVLFPLTAKQMRSMQGMSRVQPELKRLQAEYKDDRMKLQEEMTALYRREGINPVGGCLPLVAQMPVFIALFNVIRGLSSSGRLAGLQIDVSKPQYLSSSSKMYRSIVDGGGRLQSFGFDLAQSASGASGGLGHRAPYVALIVFYVVSAYVQQHLAAKRAPAAAGQAAQMQQIMKIFPIFLGIFYYSMPAGLVLYFVASNLWTIGQQEVLAKVIPTTPPVIEATSTDTSSKTDSKTGSKTLGKTDGSAAVSAAAGKGKLAKAVTNAQAGKNNGKGDTTSAAAERTGQPSRNAKRKGR